MVRRRVRTNLAQKVLGQCEIIPETRSKYVDSLFTK